MLVSGVQAGSVVPCRSCQEPSTDWEGLKPSLILSWKGVHPQGATGSAERTGRLVVTAAGRPGGFRPGPEHQGQAS